MSVSEPAASRSEVQGALGGLIASVIGVPMLGVAVVIAVVLQRTVLAKVLSRDIDIGEMQHGGTALMANTVLAVLIGFFAAGIAGMVALKLVKGAAARGFVAAAAAGALVIAVVVYRWLLPHSGGHPVSLGLLVGCGWLAALAGSWGSAALRDEPDLAA
jgi:hypothetical protein